VSHYLLLSYLSLMIGWIKRNINTSALCWTSRINHRWYFSKYNRWSPRPLFRWWRVRFRAFTRSREEQLPYFRSKNRSNFRFHRRKAKSFKQRGDYLAVNLLLRVNILFWNKLHIRTISKTKIVHDELRSRIPSALYAFNCSIFYIDA
jgi:hypothetical protein